MATLQGNAGSLCQSSRRFAATSTHSKHWTKTSVSATTAAGKCSSGQGDWQHPTADETPEVVSLRRLIAEQDAALEERRRRIEETEWKIAEYERRIHKARCARHGAHYLQRAYSLTTTSDDGIDEQDFESPGRRRLTVTNDTIAVFYRQASDDIRQHLSAVGAQLNDIGSSVERMASADGAEDSSGQVDESDVDRKVKLMVSDSALRRRGRTCRLDALRLELARADDTRRQQLVQHRRLSDAIRAAQLQLDYEELRLIAMLESHHDDSADVNVLPQPSNNELRTVEDYSRVEEDHRITGRTDPDGQAAGNAATPLGSLTSAVVTRLLGFQDHSLQDSSNTAGCKSREVLCSNIQCASKDSVSEDAKFSSLPDDDNDDFVDSHDYCLVTLV